MLQEIISKLDPKTAEQAGLVLHGLQLHPYDDGLLLSVLSRRPMEDGTVLLNSPALREVAQVFLAIAGAIDATSSPARLPEAGQR